MIQDIVRAFSELADPRSRSVLWEGIGLSVATFILVVFGADQFVSWAAHTGYPWLDRVAEVLGVVGTLVLAWFLFPSVVVAISSFFLDRVVDGTEERHFAALGRPRDIPLSDVVFSALRLLLISLVLNLAALPLYFIPGLNLPLWLGLNGYLVGREYFELVALRWMTAAEMRRERRRHILEVWIAGALIAFLLTIPFLNLVAPIVGAAFMTQRFHRLAGTRALVDLR